MDVILDIFQALSMPITVLIAVLGFVKTNQKDAKGDGAQMGTVLTELGYIKSSVDDIKTEQRMQHTWNESMATRMAAVEASAKQAHNRLDELHRDVHGK